jgi:outer membrane protein assembly factor BamB
MTRSSSFRLVLSLPVVGLPMLGCAQPARRMPDPDPLPVVLVEDVVDRRLDARRVTPGEDITALVREQNVVGKEPTLPNRHGTASFTAKHPSVKRTSDGFVAHVPGARYVGTPAHHRGRVLVGGFGTWEIHALNAETGTSAWSLNLSDDGPTDPTCQDGICVFNTYSCTMFGVEVATGKALWSWYLGSPQLATVVIQGDLVYSSYPHRGENPDANYVIAAFDLKTGTPKWRRWIDAEVNSTPVSDGRNLYVATRAGTLYQFAARDGAVIAAHKNRVATPPVLVAGAVIFGRDQPPLVDNDMLATGRVLFPQLEIEGPTRQRPVHPLPRPLAARHGLYSIENGLVVATDRRTGSRMWQQRLGSEQPADVPEPMLYAGKSILLATSNGNVLRIEPETGDVLEAFVLKQGAFASQPIAVDGWLYAGTKRGDLVAFDTGQPDLTGWEMLGGSPDRHGSADEEGT